MKSSQLVRAALAVIITVALAVAAARLDLSGAAAHWSTLHLAWLGAALAVFAGILPAWAAQWRALAPGGTPPAFATMLRVVALSATAMNTSLLLVGEAVALASLTTRARLSRESALALLALDQVVTGLFKVATAGLALLLVPQVRGFLGGAGMLALGVGALLMLVITLAHAAPRMARAGGAWWMRLTEALAPVRSLPRVARAVGFGAVKVALELLAILCIQWAFGLDLPLASTLVVCAAVGFGTAIPLVPGNVGTYEASVVVAYRAFGVDPGIALAMGVAQHACQFIGTALPGYGWVLADLSIARASR